MPGVVFEVDLLKSQEINLDYILELIFEHNKKIKSKSDLVNEVRRVIRASLGNRAKESLLVDFINQTRDLSARICVRINAMNFVFLKCLGEQIAVCWKGFV